MFLKYIHCVFASIVGPLRVEFSDPVTLDLVRSENTVLRRGGRFKPNDCIAQQKVALIIPFRNRDEHLKFWLYYLHPILQRQQLDYGVYVINQVGISTSAVKQIAGSLTLWSRHKCAMCHYTGSKASGADWCLWVRACIALCLSISKEQPTQKRNVCRSGFFRTDYSCENSFLRLWSPFNVTNNDWSWSKMTLYTYPKSARHILFIVLKSFNLNDTCEEHARCPMWFTVSLSEVFTVQIHVNT